MIGYVPEKVLAIGDQVAPQIYDAGIKTRYADVGLVLGCGDLPHYLEYVVTMLNVPLYYVMENHGCKVEYTSRGGQWRHSGGKVGVETAAKDSAARFARRESKQ